MKLVVAAPDKFRGTLTATEAARAVAAGAVGAGWSCVEVPMADGGEGTLDALGGPTELSDVTGPLGEPVRAAWRLAGDVAVVESARAVGLSLVGGRGGNDPERATTAGVGELVAAALDRGARRVVVALGGSATTDGGAGAVQVLLRRGGLRGAEVLVATDVDTRFVDAAEVFGPQKGADPAGVSRLRDRLQRTADRYLADFGVDVRDVPGAGAAGGLAGGLHALGARLVPGFDLVAAEVGLADRIAEADLVVTGEGRADPSSFQGKVVGGVATLADAARVPWLAVCGDVAPAVAGDPRLVSLTGLFGARGRRDAAGSLQAATATLLRDRSLP